MFTAGAFVLIAVIGWHVGRLNVKDRLNVAALTDDEVRTAILHARQDVKLVAFMLARRGLRRAHPCYRAARPNAH
jgi:hypothetical protein